MELPASPGQKPDGSVRGTIERMMRLQRADQDACVYEHALNAVRINAFAADGFIAQQGRCAVVAFSPLMKLASPFRRIGSLQVCNGGRWLCGMLLRYLFYPSLNR